jgi:hypothetical protein
VEWIHLGQGNGRERPAVLTVPMDIWIAYFLACLATISFQTTMLLVCFLLGNSLASEFYMPAFRNTPSVPS